MLMPHVWSQLSQLTRWAQLQHSQWRCQSSLFQYGNEAMKKIFRHQLLFASCRFYTPTWGGVLLSCFSTSIILSFFISLNNYYFYYCFYYYYHHHCHFFPNYLWNCVVKVLANLKMHKELKLKLLIQLYFSESPKGANDAATYQKKVDLQSFSFLFFLELFGFGVCCKVILVLLFLVSNLIFIVLCFNDAKDTFFDKDICNQTADSGQMNLCFNLTSVGFSLWVTSDVQISHLHWICVYSPNVYKEGIYAIIGNTHIFISDCCRVYAGSTTKVYD